MADRPLTEIIEELVQGDKVRLPVYADVAEHVLASLAETAKTPEALCQLASRDPALACYLLRQANSSFFQGLPKTRLLDEAITRLGAETAAGILETVCQPEPAGLANSAQARYLAPLWQHSLGCACGAQWLAVRCGYQALADQAYLAGLLHDIGKLFLLAALDASALAGSAGGTSGPALSAHIVNEIIDTMHVDLGRRLIVNWSLPDIYAQVIDDHHNPGFSAQDMLICLVKLANKGCHKIGLGLVQDPDMVLPTTAEAQYLGVDEIALAEFEIMLEDRFLDNQPV